MNYEKSFKKLVEQIENEYGWTLELLEKEKDNPDKLKYNRGMKFAYKSILELAEKLEKGEFQFEEEW